MHVCLPFFLSFGLCRIGFNNCLDCFDRLIRNFYFEFYLQTHQERDDFRSQPSKIKTGLADRCFHMYHRFYNKLSNRFQSLYFWVVVCVRACFYLFFFSFFIPMFLFNVFVAVAITVTLCYYCSVLSCTPNEIRTNQLMTHASFHIKLHSPHLVEAVIKYSHYLTQELNSFMNELCMCKCMHVFALILIHTKANKFILQVILVLLSQYLHELLILLLN